ncbi:MAG TPA: VWA domain-containing protein [Vicinamibacterales bacterium]|nr:VWA domain-containing protein [Vicinamibacterales bacterium]
MSRVTTAASAALIAAASLVVLAQQAQEQKPDPQRPPTFRSGAHFVGVDAYPSRDGKPITGLTINDFVVLEDGKPQAIDRLEFIQHQEWTPLAERRDPNSQRDGFELARNPNYRVFVLYLDAFHVDFSGSHAVRVPITDLLNRMMGPQDLFGVMTPLLGIKDLLLGQSTLSIQEQLEKYPHWGLISQQPLPEELELDTLYPGLTPISRLDKVYADLEALIQKLGSLREERKNIIFFSDTLPSPRPGFNTIASDPDPYRRGSDPPQIGVNDKGKLSMERANASEPNARAMREEANRLKSIDFDQRFRDLLSAARQANVSFYTVRPGGLDTGSSLMLQGTSNLAVLSEQTDGISVLATNDLRGGMSKIADDLSSHYVLGYYTNNTRWDGRARKLTVKLKSTGQTIRARREYRAPTEEEMAGLRSATSAAAAAVAPPSAGQVALSALTRVSPSSRLNAYGTVIGNEATIVAEIAAAEIEAGRWKQGADVDVLFSSKSGGEPLGLKARIEPGTRSAVIRVPTDSAPGPWQAVVRMRGEDNTTDSDTVSIEKPAGALLGKPLAYRAASAAASAYKPLAVFQFRRTERVRIEWPVSQPLETHGARLLDRAGKPMAIPLETSTKDANGVTMLMTNLNLAPFSNGDYLIEVSAKAGEKTETQTVAIRVSMAR